MSQEGSPQQTVTQKWDLQLGLPDPGPARDDSVPLPKPPGLQYFVTAVGADRGLRVFGI